MHGLLMKEQLFRLLEFVIHGVSIRASTLILISISEPYVLNIHQRLWTNFFWRNNENWSAIWDVICDLENSFLHRYKIPYDPAKTLQLTACSDNEIKI